MLVEAGLHHLLEDGLECVLINVVEEGLVDQVDLPHQESRVAQPIVPSRYTRSADESLLPLYSMTFSRQSVAS